MLRDAGPIVTVEEEVLVHEQPLKPLSFLNSSQVPAKNNTKSGEPEICDAKVNFSQSLPEASHLKFTNTPDPHVSKEKCFSKLMMDSANMQPPSSLIPCETTTLIADTNFGSLFNSLQSNGSELFAQQKHDIKEQVNVEDHELSDQLSLRSELEDPFANSSSEDLDFVPSDENEDVQENQAAVGGKSKTRKRKRQKSGWKRNIIKSARNSGAEYKNWNGNFQNKRSIKPACQNCRKRCNENFSEEERSAIFKAFGIYRTLIDSMIILPRRYMLTYNGKTVPVCKTFFLNTLSISGHGRDRISEDGSTGVVTEDRRGKACKNSQLDETIKDSDDELFSVVALVISKAVFANSMAGLDCVPFSAKKQEALGLDCGVIDAFPVTDVRATYVHPMLTG
ncbi:unnamed protein product [Acanthoscelides obtectus]|uniref:Uncharacterized protein n=1 Tax=Acanthoscelides obtectus TaxID=200917 RepID=A0A9P0PX31_ACAOB|nr:unnamed protein product [Acanthoscelides obtectus]CAK1665970.1 hypothetical protein AOBTE_LOCUS25079 [Acanthoscelides obtectus]